MATKYDTNPLDPDFPEKVRAEAEAQMATSTLEGAGAETRQFPPAAPTEEQTRRFATANFSGYSAPYSGQYVPTGYSAAAFAAPDPRKRKVDKIGLPENIMVAVPYLPFSIGLVAGVIELLLVPKSEGKVRFHAAQGLAAHIGILIVTTILGIIGELNRVAEIGSVVFTVVTTILLIIFTIKAWKGKPVHIEAIESLTNWLEEKIRIK
jgi:uncharacterized membrane protein